MSVINKMIDAACGYDPAVEQVKSEASKGAAEVLVDLSEAARFYVETGDDSAIRQAVELLRFMGWYADVALIPYNPTPVVKADNDDAILSARSIRIMHPLFQEEEGGLNPTLALHARDLIFEQCSKAHAVALVRAWHSRLPNCQIGPWTHAFHGRFGDRTYVVALWNSPSARCLPSDWRELRRMACSPDAPKNTPSRFLAWMVRWFATHEESCKHLISYQDTSVHTGTIYKAAGWTAEAKTTERIRDRSGKRAGTSRLYRWNINGVETDQVSKIRWGIDVPQLKR